MTEYNVRQFHLILDVLSAVNARVVLLGDLIAKLDAVLNTLQDVPDEWKTAYRKQWGILEDIYASALENDLIEIPQQHAPLLNEAVAKLHSLVIERV